MLRDPRRPRGTRRSLTLDDQLTRHFWLTVLAIYMGTMLGCWVATYYHPTRCNPLHPISCED